MELLYCGVRSVRWVWGVFNGRAGKAEGEHVREVSTVYLAIELQLKIRENDNNDDKMVDAVPISSPSAPPPLVEVKVIPQTPRGQEEV
eukprot:scaffold647_cov253-Ochromonas_danica.AAC.2